MTSPLGGSADEWDALYTERESIWSGQPNAQLVAEAAALSPGTALDVGCGEGADAVWLARRGWDVTAADISAVALERARVHAAAAECQVAFVHADLVAAPPRAGAYDLVSAQFFQLTEPPRSEVLRGLGAAVRPRGHLLVVGHDPQAHAGRHPERLFTTDEVVAEFSPEDWQVVTAETRERTAMHHGELTDLVDAVVLLCRTR